MRKSSSIGSLLRDRKSSVKHVEGDAEFGEIIEQRSQGVGGQSSLYNSKGNNFGTGFSSLNQSIFNNNQSLKKVIKIKTVDRMANFMDQNQLNE